VAGDLGKAAMLSMALSLMTSTVLLLMAWLRLGVAADFLSSPALLGFMNGAAVVIIGSQIGKFTGIALEEDNTLLRFFEWGSKIGMVHLPTLSIALAGIAVLVLCKWKLKKVPGAVVVFALAVIAGRIFDFSQHDVAVIGQFDISPPRPERLGLAPADAAPLFTASIGIALLVFSEGVVLGRTVAGRHGDAIDPDRELVAFGMANAAAGLCCSFAVGASQTRTLLNDATGGRTQMVSFLAAAMTAGSVLLLAPWISTIPVAAIAAILVFTGVTLVDSTMYRRLGRMHRFSMVIAVSTSVGVIALGVLPGVLLGVMLSLLGVISQIVRPQDALLGRVEGSSTMHDIGDDAAARTLPGLVAYRFYGPLIFANVRFFIERIEWFISQEQEPVRQVIIDARAIPSIDITAAEQLREFIARLRERGIEFVVAKAHLPLRQTLESIGGLLNANWRFSQLADAVDAFQHDSR
jgi:SulP family sulfate permease